MRSKTKISTVLITSTLVLSTLSVTPVTASKLSDLKDKQQQVQKEKNAANAKKQQISAQEKKVRAQIAKIDAKLSSIAAELREVRKRVFSVRRENERLKKEVATLKKRIEERAEIIADRARALQKSGGKISYVDVVLGAEDLGDLLRRVGAISTIAKADQKIIEEQEADKEDLARKQKLAATALTQLRTTEAKLTALQNEAKKEEAAKDAALKKIVNEREHVEAEINDLNEEQAILKRQESILKGQGGSKGGQYPTSSDGLFMRPAVGPVTSEFGSRWGGSHFGIDISKRSSDVPIVAAADGVVIESYYSGSYGNVIFINHELNGRTYTTVYAHLESRAVSSGSTVSRGQFIGYMGNTGQSYGAHLHFEIHEGPWNNSKSNAVNPRKYVNF
ncbi:MAG: murein hydrolase activator EnvC family protein [Bacilli bacterium]